MAEPDVLILRLTQPEQFRRIAKDLDGLFADFLRRSHEPFTTTDQWDALAHALAQGESTLFLVAFDRRVRPIGYLLAQSGMDYWRIICAFVRQLYIKPGVPSRRTTEEFEQRLYAWARAQGARAIVAGTTRHVEPFRKRFPGFTPYGVTLVKVLDAEDSHAERASENRVTAAGHHPSVPLPA